MFYIKNVPNYLLFSAQDIKELLVDLKKVKYWMVNHSCIFTIFSWQRLIFYNQISFTFLHINKVNTTE
jgi:hypothetical protein